MKKIKKIQATGFYLLQGRSSANSCFIESLEDSRSFLRYANYYLKDYVTIYEYLLTQDGWLMLVRIRPMGEFPESAVQDGIACWRIISERIRLLLSTYVRVSNRAKGRTGSLVHSSYERYYFERLSEGIRVINDIRHQRLKLYEGKKKYRGLKWHYRIPARLGKGSVLLCSRDVRRKKKEAYKMLECLAFKGFTKLVLQDFIETTKSLQIIQNHSHHHTPKHPKPPS